MSNGELTPLQAPVWVDGVTPLNSVNMTQLQTRDEKNAPSGYVGLDSGKNITTTGYIALTQASVGVAYAAAVTGDSANRILVDTNGKINWGPGNAASDTTLERWAAGQLRTGGDFLIGGVLYSAGTLIASSGSAAQTTIGNNGFGTASIQFGSGNDAILYRQAAGLLATGGEFHVRQGAAGQISISTDPTTPYIYFGSGGDTNLYRSGAGQLKTDGHFFASGQLVVDYNQDGDKLWLSGAYDTNLYRASANTLKTDGTLLVNNDLAVDRAGIGYRLYFGSALDTSLYRVAAGNLQTDQSLTVVKSLVVNTSNLTGDRIWFGSALDTSLYRSAAGQLKTDGSFWGAAEVRAGGAVWVDQSGGGNQILFGSAADTTLYRIGANNMKTDGTFNAVGTIRAGQGTANQIELSDKIYFGSVGDTTLYRSAAAQITTNSWLIAPKLSIYTDVGGFDTSAVTIYFSGRGAKTLLLAGADSGGAGYRAVVVPN